jgi:hypothetical protein
MEAMHHQQNSQGTRGKPQEVSANFIRLEMEPGRGIFEYVVTFDPVVDYR